ncbi:MAG TPA: hypothetical protein VF712_10445 [Thermoleophilaceae bacterium]
MKGPEEFWGALDVAYHRHLGIEFDRDERGRGVVTLPARPELTEPDGRHSDAALFTVGDVAAGLAVCDALLPALGEPPAGTQLGLLTTGARLRMRAAVAPGPLRGEAHVEIGPAELAAALEKTRKFKFEVCVDVAAGGSAAAAEVRLDMVFRLMRERQFDAMTARAAATERGASAHGAPIHGCRFANHVRAYLVESSPRRAVVVQADAAELDNHIGVRHAGALYGAAQGASHALALAAHGPAGLLPVHTSVACQAMGVGPTTTVAEPRAGAPLGTRAVTTTADGTPVLTVDVDWDSGDGAVAVGHRDDHRRVVTA